MSKTALTAAPILPVLADRWSPRSFDTNHQLSQHDLTAILEAARWAPSSNNGQPWRFSIAHRGDALHSAVVDGLTGFNQAWAPNASALIVVSAKKFATDGAPYKSAHYDTGLAVSLLTVQAQELGLHTHQMGGFLPDKVADALNLPDSLEVLVIVAVGKIADAHQLEGTAYEREIAPRTRLALEDIVLHGKP